MNPIAKCYGLYDKDEIIGFLATAHPLFGKKNIRRVCRLVILPDYQGIGLGVKFLNEIAEINTKAHLRTSIVTSAKNVIMTLNKNPKWTTYRYSKVNPDFRNREHTKARTVKTAAFEYVGDKKRGDNS